MLTIGQLAKETGNNTVTIRYYEKCGLIPRPKRSSGGYRLYSATLIPRFWFIKNAKTVGFSLDEIKELLTLHSLPNTKGKQIKALTLKKVTVIKAKIEALQAMQQALEYLVMACDGEMPVQECPILEKLYQEAQPEHHLLRSFVSHEPCTQPTPSKRKHASR